MPPRRSFRATLVGLALAACGPVEPPPLERVVLISIDTLRADHVGAYGAAHPTPELDALAAGGLRFATAISPAPLTLTSHTSLLTGLDPPRHGVRNNSTFRLADDVATLAEAMRESGFATAAFVGAMVLDRQYGLARGFDHYGDRMAPRLAAGSEGFPERSADRVVDEALAWLEDAPPRYLLFVHLYDPHASYVAPPAYRGGGRSPYAAEVAFVDAEIGRLLRAIDARRRLVVVTSDHGESLGDHGELTHGLAIYDATQHVPLLMHGPGLPTQVVDAPVRLVDVAPTILALAGLPPLPATDGLDLRGHWTGEPPEMPAAYLETLATQLELGWSPLYGLRNANYKLVRAPRPELYALGEDPGEVRDVYAERPEVAARLERALDARLRDGQAVEPSHRPDDESRALLESLGYLEVAAPSAERGELGVVGGTDPKDGLAQLEAIAEAWTEASESGSDEALAKLAAIEGGGFLRVQLGAQAALDAGDAERAEHFAREAVVAAPGFWESHNTLGRALLLRGRLDEAETAFTAAASLDAAAADPLVGLGRVAEARGDGPRAMKLYTTAGERRGNSSEALWRLAALHLEAGRDRHAHRILSSLGTEPLTRPAAALRLARAEASGGRIGAARSRLDAALARKPRHAALLAARDALPADGS